MKLLIIILYVNLIDCKFIIIIIFIIIISQISKLSLNFLIIFFDGGSFDNSMSIINSIIKKERRITNDSDDYFIVCMVCLCFLRE